MNKFRAQSNAAQAARRKFRMCERKVGFPTAEAPRQPGQDIYRCKYCGQWHRTGQLAALLAMARRVQA